MKRSFVFALLLSCLQHLSAQSFAVSDTTVELEVTTSNGVAHWYTALSNLTTDTVFLRWKQFRASDYPTASWTTFLQDPQTWYNPVDGVDSGDFFLDTVVDPLDKLVLQVDHHGIADRGDIDFLIFDINNPSDSVVVHYHVQINQANTISETKTANWLRVTGSSIEVTEEVQLLHAFTISGQQLRLDKVGERQYQLPEFSANDWILLQATLSSGEQRTLKIGKP